MGGPNKNIYWETTIFNNHFTKGTARFYADSRTHSVTASSPNSWGELLMTSDRRPFPIPDIPPYFVRTPHMHGAPPTDETKHDYGKDLLARIPRDRPSRVDAVGYMI